MIIKLCFSGSDYCSLYLINNIFFSKFYFSFVLSGVDKILNNKIIFNSLKIFCKNFNLVFFQFNNLYFYNNLNLYNYYIFEKIEKLKLKFFIIINYGYFFSKNFLLFSKIGFINIHFSLLPCYKGSIPIQGSLLNFNIFFGFTMIFLKNQIDSGVIVSFFKFNINYFYIYKILKYKNFIIISLFIYKILLFLIKYNFLFIFYQQNNNNFYSLLS